MKNDLDVRRNRKKFYSCVAMHVQIISYTFLVTTQRKQKRCEPAFSLLSLLDKVGITHKQAWSTRALATTPTKAHCFTLCIHVISLGT